MGKNALRLHNVQLKTNVATGCALNQSTHHKQCGMCSEFCLWWSCLLRVFANAIRRIRGGMKLTLGINRQAEMRTNL